MIIKILCPALLILFSFAAPAWGQQRNDWRIQGKPLNELRKEMKGGISSNISRKEKLLTHYNAALFSGSANEKLLWVKGAGKLPADFSSTAHPSFSPQDLAFFCRLEFRMEKALRFPVKIRLGEVQYVEEMEGKITSMKTNPSRR